MDRCHLRTRQGVPFPTQQVEKEKTHAPETVAGPTAATAVAVTASTTPVTVVQVEPNAAEVASLRASLEAMTSERDTLAARVKDAEGAVQVAQHGLVASSEAVGSLRGDIDAAEKVCLVLCSSTCWLIGE